MEASARDLLFDIFLNSVKLEYLGLMSIESKILVNSPPFLPLACPSNTTNIYLGGVCTVKQSPVSFVNGSTCRMPYCCANANPICLVDYRLDVVCLLIIY